MFGRQSTQQAGSQPLGTNNAVPDPNGQLLTVDHVTKRYAETTVLYDVSLSVGRDDVVAICGPSGSGKSTLLRCMSGLESVQSGRVSLRGIPVNKPRVHRDIRGQIGFVFQNFNLFSNLSLLKNVSLAPRLVRGKTRDESEQLARSLLDRVGLSDRARAYPSELSGGQRQRGAIARALAMQPTVMLFDEPTSALDVEMIKEVLDVIRELAEQGMSICIVTHEMRFARTVATQVCFMDEGRMIERARPSDFFENPKSSRLRKFLDQVS